MPKTLLFDIIETSSALLAKSAELNTVRKFLIPLHTIWTQGNLDQEIAFASSAIQGMKDAAKETLLQATAETNRHTFFLK